ncbi:MAG: hypothetical protein QXE05_05885 [Nitrososphaeria archaeon]
MVSEFLSSKTSSPRKNSLILQQHEIEHFGRNVQQANITLILDQPILCQKIITGYKFNRKRHSYVYNIKNAAAKFAYHLKLLANATAQPSPIIVW